MTNGDILEKEQMKTLNKHHLQNQIPAGAVNIMRGSIFGNPFVIGKDGDRSKVIASFKSYLWKRMQTDQPFVEAIRNLNGKDLYRCCAPKACHGDILISACLWLNKA